MGWNEARVLLTPPRWRQTVQQSQEWVSGRTFYLRHPERDSNKKSPIMLDTFEQWLLQQGFTRHEQSDLHSAFGINDIRIFLARDGDELTELELTFTLTKESPSALERWQTLVTLLCDTWGFQLFDPLEGGRFTSDAFYRILTGTSAWIDFQAYFKWPTVSGGHSKSH